MNRILALTLVLIAVLLGCGSDHATTTTEDEFWFVGSFQLAKAQASQLDKAILIYFYLPT